MNAFRTGGIILSIICLISCKKESVYTSHAKPELSIGNGDARLSAAAIHLVKDTVYRFAANMIRNNGQELIIDAGTLIKVSNGVSIDINPGATIKVNGTKSDPVIFTSTALKGAGGDADNSWNGISITGNASATLTYMRIEFAGASRSSLSLIDLGNENVINNIQISYSQNSASYDFSGSNVNAFNLVSYAAAGTDFRIRNGYTGMLRALLAYRHAYFAANNAAGITIDGSETFPAISNVTVLGPDTESGNFIYSGNRVVSLLTTGKARFHIRNSVFMGFPKGGFYLDNKETALSLVNAESDFKYSIVHSNDSSLAFFVPSNIYMNYTAEDFKNYMLQPDFHNLRYLNSDNFLFTDPFNYDNHPNPSPKNNSPLLTGANFEGAVFNNSFFIPVSYIGASGTDNWMQDWTNFTPLQTNYNN